MNIKALSGILRTSFFESFQYRAVLLSRVTVNAFWGAVHATIMLIYFRYGAGASPGMTAAQAVSYIWIGQILFNLQPGFYDGAVWEKIRTGDIGVELLRPLDLYAHWFMRTAAVRIVPFLNAIIPITLIASIMPSDIALQPPASLAGLGACAVLVVGALIFSCAVQCFLYSMMTSHIWGPEVTNMASLVVQIFAGAYLPLALWPDAMQRFLLLQPFASAWDLPLRMYLGMSSPADLPGMLALQLLWSAAFILLGRAILRGALHKIVIQGG